ncbi:BatD family protein [Chryseosolibacter indicus]|uniref:BatD family protein n=1 Tax=Chryseosolibacter indicus TaxID=2782351 RepID=A0ABS5VQ50_9BACT|nr:BatD family protein [Chryseosolibacter indicus]MBT1702980.1 BatD family protein [Chryseosolibacter indicus]
MKQLYFKISLVLILFSFNYATAQDVKVTLGPDEVGENQGWTITVTVQNERLRSYDNFPDIDGFRKRGTSTQSTTNIVNGQMSSSQSVIMTYFPLRQGTFTIPSFSMKVNDQTINVTGKKVKVGPAVQQRDPFKSFFDSSPADDFFGREETEFVDVKDDAFLAITTNKDEVYVGEGFNTTLSFFVSADNRAPLQFYDLAKQLTDILKKIKPNDAWEENFNIENIEGETVTINGKEYTQYKIYQATYYPLNAEPIVFPSVALEMIKYKVARNPSFFGQNRKEDFKKFHSKPKTVIVKELPPHPLRDVVAVGDYKLTESMPSTKLETGKSAAYTFSVYGEGNISAIEKPLVQDNDNFEFYDPNVRQDINRDNGRVTGTKSFNYFLIPNEPGEFKLGDHFQWVFFNTTKRKYDTLRSKITVHVSGESRKNEAIQSTDLGSFYDRIDTANNTLQALEDKSWMKVAFNAFILVVLGASAYLVFKK